MTKDESFVILVVLYNLRGYDSHHIMGNIDKFKRQTHVIANTIEKYICFTIGNTRFIGSMQFMGTSLEILEGKDRFHHMCQYISNLDQQDLPMRKDGYYVDLSNKLEETSLPPKNSFYSLLSGQGISKKEYDDAQKVW